MEQTQMKEVFDSLCVLPRDIERLCPRVGEPVYVDVDGDGDFRIMLIESIGPRYVTLRKGEKEGFGLVDFLVPRNPTEIDCNFVFWWSSQGGLHCKIQKVEGGE